MIKKAFALSILILYFATQLAAQTRQEIVFDATQLFSATETYGTPLHEENDGKKHYVVGFTGMLVTVALISSYNRFISRAPWAQVGWDDIKSFYDKEIKWDKDWYWTNFVLHPYQGALSYMVGRSANWNRIESFALATFADFAWEYFCETNSPSKNDLVYSSIGAFPVGEMLYRLSLEAEQLSRLLGYVVNPERLWTEWLLKQRPLGTSGNIYELSVGIDMGAQFVRSDFGSHYDTLDEIYPFFAAPYIAIVYNDPYGHDSNNPYSQFNLDIGFAFGASSGEGITSLEEVLFHDIHILSDGMLFARAPTVSERTDTTIGLVFEYDFVWNNVYQLSSLAPGVAFKQRIRYEKSAIEWQAHVAGIVLGTTDITYLYRGVMDDMEDSYHEYNYTVGAETVLRWKWKSHRGHALAFDIHGYAMYDFADQKQDFTDTGWELIGIGSASYEIPLSNRVRLGLHEQLYVKASLFDTFDRMTQLANATSLYAKLQLK